MNSSSRYLKEEVRSPQTPAGCPNDSSQHLISRHLPECFVYLRHIVDIENENGEWFTSRLGSAIGTR